MEDFIKHIKQQLSFLFFQDMGNLGEGFMVGCFYWFVILFIVVLLGGIYIW